MFEKQELLEKNPQTQHFPDDKRNKNLGSKIQKLQSAFFSRN